MHIPFGGEPEDRFGKLLGKLGVGPRHLEIKGGQGSSATSKGLRAVLDAKKEEGKKAEKNEKPDKEKQ